MRVCKVKRRFHRLKIGRLEKTVLPVVAACLVVPVNWIVSLCERNSPQKKQQIDHRHSDHAAPQVHQNPIRAFIIQLVSESGKGNFALTRQRYIGLGKAQKNSLGMVRDIHSAEHHRPIRANGFNLSGNFYVAVIPDETEAA